MSSKARFVLFSAIAIAVVIGYVVLRRPMSVVEVDYSTPDAVASAIDKGWLPTWFPGAAFATQGAHETFDNNLVWLTFRVRPGGESFLGEHCELRRSADVWMPTVDYMRRFPADVREAYERSRSGSMKLYSCSDVRRTFFVAADESESNFILWAN